MPSSQSQRVTPATTRDCHHCENPMEVPETLPEEWTVVCVDCYPIDGDGGNDDE